MYRVIVKFVLFRVLHSFRKGLFVSRRESKPVAAHQTAAFTNFSLMTAKCKENYVRNTQNATKNGKLSVEGLAVA